MRNKEKMYIHRTHIVISVQAGKEKKAASFHPPTSCLYGGALSSSHFLHILKLNEERGKKTRIHTHTTQTSSIKLNRLQSHDGDENDDGGWGGGDKRDGD